MQRMLTFYAKAENAFIISQTVVDLGLGSQRQGYKGALWRRHHTQPTVMRPFDQA